MNFQKLMIIASLTGMTYIHGADGNPRDDGNPAAQEDIEQSTGTKRRRIAWNVVEVNDPRQLSVHPSQRLVQAALAHNDYQTRYNLLLQEGRKALVEDRKRELTAAEEEWLAGYTRARLAAEDKDLEAIDRQIDRQREEAQEEKEEQDKGQEEAAK